MFDIEFCIAHFQNYLLRNNLIYDLDQLRTVSIQLEQLFLANCLQNLQRNFNGTTLHIILGEASQNVTNYVYGENAAGIRRNSFLPVRVVIPQMAVNDFTAQSYQNTLARQGVIILDTCPLPLPSDYYRGKHGKPKYTPDNNHVTQFLNHTCTLLQEFLLEFRNIQSIKVIRRYKKIEGAFRLHLEKELESRINPNIQIVGFENSLSNGAGNIDVRIYNEFLNGN